MAPQGVEVESVAWDGSNTDSASTGSFLVGAADGNIYETIIEAKKCKKFTSVRFPSLHASLPRSLRSSRGLHVSTL